MQATPAERWFGLNNNECKHQYEREEGWGLLSQGGAGRNGNDATGYALGFIVSHPLGVYSNNNYNGRTLP